MVTLLLVRPAAQSHRLVEALSARGLRPAVVISPVVEIRMRPVSVPEGVDVVLTSQNAVAALPRRALRAWCVGDRTAEAARAAGLEAVSAGGDVEDLLAALIHAKPGPLVHVRGAHATGDLVARLRANGLRADEVIAYDQIRRPLSPEGAAVLASPGDVVLPLYSPRTAALVAAHDGPWHASLHVVAISQAAADAWGRPTRLRVASEPGGAAMEDAIAAVLCDLDGSRLVDRGGAG